MEELGAVMASIGLQPSKVELLSMIGKVDAGASFYAIVTTFWFAFPFQH